MNKTPHICWKVRLTANPIGEKHTVIYIHNVSIYKSILNWQKIDLEQNIYVYTMNALFLCKCICCFVCHVVSQMNVKWYIFLARHLS